MKGISAQIESQKGFSRRKRRSKCVFAGTFDPFSKGHEYIVDKCLDLFDEVVIAIGVNVDKKPMFTLDERKQIILAKYSENKRVRVCSFEGMLVDFMRKENIIHTVRGIRDEVDYKYESVMAKYNEDLFPDVVSIFIPKGVPQGTRVLRSSYTAHICPASLYSVLFALTESSPSGKRKRR